ncbi:flagellar motor switch protein FliG [Dissulfurirhabdus thermomarina]|uniref:Flagellar motor switch protein FliG n=1 Tax=Dissulfurirhabdus thermomarina TaxID=1765737 RepID=A0A6N9TNQ2_DISTH|nr:flagellar motor switch protein FliG [Dissulfurirhabdus thermomarina]NDY42885.1 flagellar motor switch protein FliG [Dissulfurirhabdus thermomarina]NMX23902.1 flagellar motor switch protein FliG [Dissulfurirhabdus thermomarina]
MDLTDPKGVEKAAVFLLTMGEQYTAEVFKHLSEDEVRRVSRVMAHVTNIPGEAVEKITDEVRTKMALVQGDMAVSVEDFLKKVLYNSMPEDQAERILTDILHQLHPSTFQKLTSLEPKVIVNFLRNEHPQTIAVILAHLSPELSAAVLGELPEKMQHEVIKRIATLDKINPDIIAEIDRVLEEELFTVEMSDATKVGGTEKVAEILNNVDRTLEEGILEKIESESVEMAEEIRKLMFKFEDLLEVDDTAIIAILKEISTEELKMAIKAASEELREKFYSNMSERASQMLKEDLEIMGPVRLKDVEMAQQMIIKVAKRLESEGKIVLGGKGGDEILV